MFPKDENALKEKRRIFSKSSHLKAFPIYVIKMVLPISVSL